MLVHRMSSDRPGIDLHSTSSRTLGDRRRAKQRARRHALAGATSACAEVLPKLHAVAVERETHTHDIGPPCRSDVRRTPPHAARLVVRLPHGPSDRSTRDARSASRRLCAYQARFSTRAVFEAHRPHEARRSAHVRPSATMRRVAGSFNGRTAAFEAVNLGSNPSPAATPRKLRAATRWSLHHRLSGAARASPSCRRPAAACTARASRWRCVAAVAPRTASGAPRSRSAPVGFLRRCCPGRTASTARASRRRGRTHRLSQNDGPTRSTASAVPRPWTVDAFSAAPARSRSTFDPAGRSAAAPCSTSRCSMTASSSASRSLRDAGAFPAAPAGTRGSAAMCAPARRARARRCDEGYEPTR